MLYFAYGSNLSIEQMSHRCPKSAQRRSIKLDGYELAFVGFHKRWKGGIATIVPKPGGVTYGALYSMTVEDVEKLDKFESIETGIYRKMDLVIDGVTAYTYICTIEEYNSPSIKYLDTIKKGFGDWGLPLGTLSAIDTCD
ncbi:MAG: gamma-glutamylcyclotransferase [Bacteroidales bacterium]|nr:gamma-glutamylcyclotransferase [Bacteroidales bacterium]